jgi:NAD(P)-dependent dehydrogenase (short-subunit alcohol dehydrogenase family)
MLTFKNCVIFGATGNLGKAITLFINNQCNNLENLVFTGRTSTKVVDLQNSLNYENSLEKSNKTKITGITNDLSINSQRMDLRNQIHNNLKSNLPDLLIFSIGTHVSDKSGAGNLEKIISTNLTAPLSEAQYWIPLMKGGSVIFFSDAMISKPMTGYSAYYSAKSGIETAAKILAGESAPKVRVNVIAPGIMNLKPTAKPDATTRWGKQIPMGKIGGFKPIIDALHYLLNEEYVTGIVLKIDGGLHLP